MKTFKKLKKGFTLVELVVVIAVIAILAAVSVGAYFGVTESANNSKLEQEAKQVYTAIQTVALAPNDHSNLSSSGLTIKDEGKFEDAIIEMLGHDVYTTSVEKERSETLPTIYFSSAEYDSRVGAGSYKTFEYYIPGITHKKAVADVVTGECKVADAGDTTIADEDAGKVWYLVRDAAELSAGDKIIVAAKNYDFAMSTAEGKNNRAAEAITKNEELAIIDENIQVIILNAGTQEGTFSFSTEEGYLYASSNSENHLKVTEELNQEGNDCWKITIDDDKIASIVAQGDKTRNILKYNNSSKLFSCYASGQADVVIYKLGFYEKCEHNFGENLPRCTECGEVNPNYVKEEPNVETKTVAELKSITAIKDRKYSVTGYIIGWNGSNTTGGSYGAYYIADSISYAKEQAMLVYGSTTSEDALNWNPVTEEYEFNNPKNFNGSSYKIGDKVELTVIIDYFENGDFYELLGIINNHESSPASVVIAGDFNGWTAEPLEQSGHTYTISIENVSANSGFKVGVGTQAWDSSYDWHGGNISINGNEPTGEHASNALFTDSGTWEIEVNFLNKTCVATLVASESEQLLTLDFSDETNRVSWDANSQIWSQNNILFVNTKANSSSDVIESSDPVRLYKNSNIEISITGIDDAKITKIIFDANTEEYASDLAESISECTISGQEVTVVLNKVSYYSLILTAGQVRLNSISVTYEVIDASALQSISANPTTHTFTDNTALVPSVTGTYTFGSNPIPVSELTYTASPEGIVNILDGSITPVDDVFEGTTEVTITSKLNSEKTAKILITIDMEESVEEPITGKSYTKVTSDLSDWSGTYLIVYEDGNDAYIHNGIDDTSEYDSGVISNSAIVGDSFKEVTIARFDTGYSVMINGQYLSGTSGSNKTNFGNSPSLNTIKYENDSVLITSDTSVLRFNAASNQLRFRYYKSSSYASQKPIQLYKLNEG